jgi:hypothetical protein
MNFYFALIPEPSLHAIKIGPFNCIEEAFEHQEANFPIAIWVLDKEAALELYYSLYDILN